MNSSSKPSFQPFAVNVLEATSPSPATTRISSRGWTGRSVRRTSACPSLSSGALSTVGPVAVATYLQGDLAAGRLRLRVDLHQRAGLVGRGGAGAAPARSAAAAARVIDGDRLRGLAAGWPAASFEPGCRAAPRPAARRSAPPRRTSTTQRSAEPPPGRGDGAPPRPSGTCAASVSASCGGVFLAGHRCQTRTQSTFIEVGRVLRSRYFSSQSEVSWLRMRYSGLPGDGLAAAPGQVAVDAEDVAAGDVQCTENTW